MSRLPQKVIYDLGRDALGRKLELIEEGLAITLHREPAHQRDDAVRLEITREQAAAIGEVVKP